MPRHRDHALELMGNIKTRFAFNCTFFNHISGRYSQNILFVYPPHLSRNKENKTRVKELPTFRSGIFQAAFVGMSYNVQ